MSLDLSSFDTRKVTNMKYMFNSFSATSLDLSNFDTSKVTDMEWMFQYSKATSILVDREKWVESTRNTGMFNNCSCSSVTLK